MPVVWLPFLGSWIINEFENSGKWGSAPDKQNVRVTCPTGKVEFKYFSSPVLHVRTKTQENFLSVFIFEEAKEVKIWWNWGIQCGRSFARWWVVLQPRWMCILSLICFICLQAVNTHRVRLLAHMLVPPQDFPFLASWGMVIKNIWRSKRCNVEHNTNSADKIFCAKEIAAVYIQTFSKFLVFCSSNDNSVITLRRIFAPEL